MSNLRFVSFNNELFEIYSTWFTEEKWLSLPDENWLRYVTTNPHSFSWMVFDGDKPVGQLQVDLLKEDPTRANLAVITAPQERRWGYGILMLEDMMKLPALSQVRLFYGFIEPKNFASIGLVEKAGFKLASPIANSDGLLEYTLKRY